MCLNKCGRRYLYLRNMKQHMRYECGVEKRFHCWVCSKGFHYRHLLNAHVKSAARCKDIYEQYQNQYQ